MAMRCGGTLAASTDQWRHSARLLYQHDPSWRIALDSRGQLGMHLRVSATNVAGIRAGRPSGINDFNETDSQIRRRFGTRDTRRTVTLFDKLSLLFLDGHVASERVTATQ